MLEKTRGRFRRNYYNVVNYEGGKCVVWPSLIVATLRRERGDRAIEQICLNPSDNNGLMISRGPQSITSKIV